MFQCALMCFDLGQVSICDYWRCSVQLMKRDIRRQDWPSAMERDAAPISEEMSVKIGASAFQTARKMASLCSGLTDNELSAMLKQGTGKFEDYEDDPDPEEGQKRSKKCF